MESSSCAEPQSGHHRLFGEGDNSRGLSSSQRIEHERYIALEDRLETRRKISCAVATVCIFFIVVLYILGDLFDKGYINRIRGRTLQESNREEFDDAIPQWVESFRFFRTGQR